MCLYGFARDAHIIDILIINVYYSSRQDMFEDNKSKIRSVFRRRIDNYNCQRQKGQYDKQRSTKHYTENERIEQQTPHLKLSEELRCSSVSAPHMAPLVLLVL